MTNKNNMVKSRFFIKLTKTDWDTPDCPDEWREERDLFNKELTKEEFDKIYRILDPIIKEHEK